MYPAAGRPRKVRDVYRASAVSPKRQSKFFVAKIYQLATPLLYTGSDYTRILPRQNLQISQDLVC